MNIKPYLDKHNDRTLKDEEWENLAKSLLEAKFDREKKAEWTQKLAGQGVHRTAPASTLTGVSFIRKYMAAAAVLLLMLAAGWFFFLRSDLSPTQQMASQYLKQPFQLNQGNMRGEESTEKNRGKAAMAFELKQYEEALSYLRIIESEGNAKAGDYFQMGLCLMYQQKPDYTKAVNAFNAAQKLDAGAYTDEINWFNGLCYLMKNDEASATVFLQKVVESPSSRNQEEAAALLARMKGN